MSKHCRWVFFISVRFVSFGWKLCACTASVDALCLACLSPSPPDSCYACSRSSLSCALLLLCSCHCRVLSCVVSFVLHPFSLFALGKGKWSRGLWGLFPLSLASFGRSIDDTIHSTGGKCKNESESTRSSLLDTCARAPPLIKLQRPLSPLFLDVLVCVYQSKCGTHMHIHAYIAAPTSLSRKRERER